MRLPFISMVILMLAAAVAPLPSDAANIKVPKSAATLAMGSVDSGEIHLTNIRVNGQPISQPVAPGSTVQISFDWTISVVPGCPICNIQGYIGFQGTAATCFKSLDHPPRRAVPLAVVSRPPTKPARSSSW